MTSRISSEQPRILMNIFQKLYLEDTPIKQLLPLFQKLIRKLRLIDNKLEIILEIASLGEEKFIFLTKQLHEEIADLIAHLSYNKLRFLLLYLAYRCPKCFTHFISEFKKYLSKTLLEHDFNDAIILAIDIARVNEELATIFIKTYLDTFKHLSKTEGMTHLGTVVWHISMLGYRNLAWCVFENLVDDFIERNKSPRKIAWLLLTLSKIDDMFLRRAVNRLKRLLIEILCESAPEQRKIFISVISRSEELRNYLKSSIECYKWG